MAETVAIAALGAGGDGIAEVDGARVFVPYTLPGEVVEIERAGSRGRTTRIVSASPDRIAPICRHFGNCGGCALQQMAGDAYLDWKREVVARSFALHGISAEPEPMVPVRPGTRRRAVFSSVNTVNGIILGFTRRGSNEIIPVEECPLLVPAIAARLPFFREIAGQATRRGKRVRITVVAADNGLDIAIDGASRLDRAARETLGAAAGDPSIARLTVNGEEVFQNRRPEIAAGGATLFPAPAGFLQAVASAEGALADAVLGHVGDAAPIADLFAGIGTFSLRLARRSRVAAVDSDAALLAGLDMALRHTQGLKPVSVVRRDLFANPLAPRELDGFDAVVFDPPAAGAKRQAQAIAGSTVTRVAAVSCNPATLARDARVLIDGGYRLTRLLPIDQFLFSAEIEIAALFER